jgi:hypothetical protein
MFTRKDSYQGKYNDEIAQHNRTKAAYEALRKEKQAVEKDFATTILQMEEKQAWIHTACQAVASLPSNRKIKALEALRDEAQTKGWIE